MKVKTISPTQTPNNISNPGQANTAGGTSLQCNESVAMHWHATESIPLAYISMENMHI